jgi:hypothetical protein
MTVLKHSGLAIACAASLAVLVTIVLLSSVWALRGASLVQSPVLIAMSVFASAIIALIEFR